MMPNDATPSKPPSGIRLRGAALTMLPFTVAAVVCTVVYLALRERLPDPVAIHFGSSGEADDFSGRGTVPWVLLAVNLGLGVLFSVMTYLSAMPARAQRTMVAAGFAVAGLLGHLFTAVLFANADVADARAVTLPMDQLAIALGVALVAGAAGWALASLGTPPEPEPAKEPGPARRLPLAEGETASWSRVTASPALPVIGAALLLAGLVLALLELWAAALPLLLSAVLLFAFSGVRVTADRRGVVLSLTLVPGLRRTITLSRIERAVNRPVSCFAEFGGWGYRVRPGRSGVVLRSGDALALQLGSGREFVVTVDDAATAAALLNTLIDRRGRPGEH